MSSPTLLLVDDEDHIRSMLEAALGFHGFAVHAVQSGRAALAEASSTSPDVIVLDVMMPDLDGFEVCRRLRSDGHKVPILFLTAKDDTEDKVRGLTIGGDDYLVKPFSLEELVARVNALLRRSGKVGRNERLRCGPLEMDEDAHAVRVGGREVSLSPTEFNLLRYLLHNQNRVVSKTQILDQVWRMDFAGDARIVETYVGYLRKKVDTVGARKLIHTVRGVGYMLSDRDSGEPA